MLSKVRGNKLIWVIALAISFATSLILPGQSHAASNPADTYIVSNNNFYVYVQATENLDVSFTKLLNTPNNTNSTVTIWRPGAANTICTLNGTTAVGDPASDCVLPNLTASQTGIWRIQFTGGGSGHDRYTWTINAQNGAVDIPGRVWSEAYALEEVLTEADMQVWFQSEYGYQYRTNFLSYNGLDSVIEASSLGLVQPGTCLPLYKSVTMNTSGFAKPDPSCHSVYKLFFEPPASDLPASSTRWNGSTDWIKPPIVPPSIHNLTFTSSSTGSRDGTITFDPLDYKGPVTVQIDVNNNGSYTDPIDVSMPVAAEADPMTVAFDGLDGNGNAIPANQAITFRVGINRVAEIHFLAEDVERRAGGIEVTRLNGPAGDESLIYWDDTDFIFPDPNHCPDPLTGVVPDGTAGFDSTGGVHAWTTTGCPGGPPQNGGNANDGIHGSWGDYRIINDWAFAPANVSATYTLAAYGTPAASTTPASSAPTLAATGSDRTALVTLVAVILLAAATSLVATKKWL